MKKPFLNPSEIASKQLDNTSDHSASERTSDSERRHWPSLPQDLIANSASALADLLDHTLPKPFNAQAQLFDEAAPFCANLSLPLDLRPEATDRMLQAARLAELLAFDLGDMPVEAREALNTAQMSDWHDQVADILVKKIEEMRINISDLNDLSKAVLGAFVAGKVSYTNPELVDWHPDTCAALAVHGVCINSTDDTSHLYKTMATTWRDKEHLLIQATLGWLMTCLQSHRFMFYRAVGQHLSDEASWLQLHGVTEGREESLEDLPTVFANLAKAPFLTEWPVVLREPKNPAATLARSTRPCED